MPGRPTLHQQLNHNPSAAVTMLKRKLDETMEDGGRPNNASTSYGQLESDDSNCSNGSTDALAPGVALGPPPVKRMKKRVNFKDVSVFYFPRRQGFTCVPSEGGSTLGMSDKHSFMRDFTVSDYTKEQKRIHRTILAEQHRQGKMFPSPLLASNLAPIDNGDVSSGSGSDSQYDDYYFLQPLPIRQRRVLLRTAGVRKIDNEEKDECRDIRVSRIVCGCDCRLFCNPATCSCTLAGIQCQVDRLSFPCGCTNDGCCNPAGRIEFNPIRVRTHFIHTLMRLELERTDSQCQDGKLASTSSTFPCRSLASVEEIDVVGANGAESVETSPDNSNDVSENCCNGTTADASSNEDTKALKSKLKTKKEESIDLNMFNSNEKGSCRDCQNTDMCNVMMHDVKFSMVTQQQRQHQQQQVITAAMGPQPGYPGPQLQQQHHMSLSSGMSLLHLPPALPDQQQLKSHHMLLFNDGKEEAYHAENTSSMYFDNDDSSYSEISSTSPDVIDNPSFSSVSQVSFPGNLHLLPSQIFPSNISSACSSSTGTVHSQSLVMPKQVSLLNSSCVQTLPVNGGCGVGPSSTSCNNVRLEQQQQQCGLLSHSQQSAAVMPNQSLLRPPFLPAAPQLLTGQCERTLVTAVSVQGLHSQSRLLSHTHMDNNLEQVASGCSLLVQGTSLSFQDKFDHTYLLETPVPATPSSYTPDPSMQASNSFSPYSTAKSSTDYLSQPSHINISIPATSAFDDQATSTSGNEGHVSFQSLQATQHSSWSSTLDSPTLRLGSSSPETVSSSIDDRENELDVSAYHHEPDSCSVTRSPASPNSSTITYATMTTTTRDLLAAHCPGISSHMDGKLEPNGSAIDSAPAFSTYHLSTDGTDTSSLLGTSQNLLFGLSYADTSSLASCDHDSTTLTSPQQNSKTTDSLKKHFSNETLLPTLPSSSFSKPLFASPPVVSSSLTPEPSSTAHLFSAIQSTCLSPCLPSSTTFSESYQTHTEVPNIFVHTSEDSHLCSQGEVLPIVSIAAEELMDREESISGTCFLENGQSACEHVNCAETELCIWRSKCDMKEGSEEHLRNMQFRSLSSEMQDPVYEKDRNDEACAADLEVVSSLSSSTTQSNISFSASSSSSPTSEEEKDQTISQGVGEIIKESIAEMVLV